MILLRHPFDNLAILPLAIFLLVVAICCTVVLLAPWIGLGADYEFLLFRLIGVSRSEALNELIGLALTIVIVVGLFQFLRAQVGVPGTWSRSLAAATSALVDISDVTTGAPSTRRELWITTAIAAAFFLAFIVLLSKCLIWFKLHLDQHWWQAMVDYDIEWGTPIFSFGANLLYNFGIQVPSNGQLLPFEGLAHWFPIEMRIPATVTFCFIWTGALFWVVAGLFGLRPVYRPIFGGIVGLIVTIPNGLDRLIWIYPQNFFTHQFTLASWWGEAPILLLTTVVFFFYIGNCRYIWSNLVASTGFALGAFAAVLAYPVGSVFFVPIMALYCLGLFLTCESRNELLWKAGASLLLGGVMLAAQVPQFFINLYSYTSGSYFYAFSADEKVWQGILPGNWLLYAHSDLRSFFVYAVAFIGATIAAFKAKGPLRRIAIAVLLCETGIIVCTTINAFFFGYALAGAYAELAHAPLWGSFSVLAVIFFALFVDYYLAEFVKFIGRHSPLVDRMLDFRAWGYGALFSLIIVRIWWVIPVEGHFSTYPPEQPASVKLLSQDLGLSPGAQFRGRMMTWVPAGLVGPNDRLHFDEIVANHYRLKLGNDHFIDILPFNIPTVNEYGHMTSPATFAFFRVFMMEPGQLFGRAWFLFSKFDLRIARLIGVRMVVTDGSSVPGGTLVYETMAGDTPLRIFRLEHTNIGQYSPVRTHQVNSAAEAIAIIRPTSFDPEQDVVVEAAIPGDLVAATSAVVTVDRGPTLTVRAKSPGRTLLVLPFEYSHCLQINSGGAEAKLLPVNLQQTGLLFERDVEVEISYHFGLFGASRCRGQDVKRLDELNFKALLMSKQ